ncbi:putative signal transduction protein with EAL and GGDEF domain [Conyzicola lurida]|uniref:Putative signal transduction protein with EAL and GGDEF domain n=1 Tax=Conyzicola lurida TaxID=1172621 RepID=A0A841AN93_9MICO|nr:putative signal transduction protein with EAL and GGDEF domain [Conyzicola lurida]
MRIRAIDLVDVFVYLVVLGLFTQIFPAVISETFVLALLTAILLKVVLEVVLLVKKRTIERIRMSRLPVVRIANVVVLLLVLPGSKFLVLELVALVFGDSVYLGGFFQVTALIIVLMLARGGVRRLLPEEQPTAGPE